MTDEFEELVKPLIKYLNERGNPHSTIIVTTTDAELLDGARSFHTSEFVKD